MEKKLKAIVTILVSFLIGLYGGIAAVDVRAKTVDSLAAVEAVSSPFERSLREPFNGKSLSGNYLSSKFAQSHHDWKNASKYLSEVIRVTPDNPQLLKRSMVLSAGHGDVESSMSMAEKIIVLDKDDSLARLFLAIKSFHDQDYERAESHVQKIPYGSVSKFIMPIIRNWSKAAIGVSDDGSLVQNTFDLEHAILIADFLGEHRNIESLLDKVMASSDVSIGDMERIADIYAHINKNDKAFDLYERISKKNPDNDTISYKFKALKSGKKVSIFEAVKTPEEGIAIAMYDMSQILYGDNSDDGARVFANIALYLNPDLYDVNLLMAAISSRNERYGEAISYYQKIPPESINFMEARRRAAELLEDDGDIDGALAELKVLVDVHGDLEALIRIGDIYRRNEDFARAITVYNKAESRMGGKIPAKYWHLHYIRGMSYERSGQWDKAQADLTAALAFQPNHPLVLNYLGYAWADQGVNLKQALALVRKAVSFSPSDGYIVDSLGWVYFRMGEYKKSIPHLEKSVELLPYDSVINDHLGDAYWQVGRHLEARFQWERAKNYSDDEKQITRLARKLDEGLIIVDIVKEAASTQIGETDIRNP